MTPQKAIGSALVLLGGLLFLTKSMAKKAEQVPDNTQETETEQEAAPENDDVAVDNSDVPA